MSDALALWSPTLQAVITSIDLGNVVAGSSDDWRFQVKNLSAVYAARDVQVSTVGTDAEQFYLSADATRFTASLSLGDLPATAASPVLTLRRVTPSVAATGARSCSLRIQLSSWQ